MRSAMLLLTTCVLLTGMTIAEESDDTYRNPTVGITVTKPANWHFTTAEENLENLQRTKLKDDEFLKYVQLHATAPLVAMTKYAEPYDDLNPSFKVIIRPLGQLPGDDPAKMTELVLPQLGKQFDDFSIEEGPLDTVISGLKAAYVKFHYSLQTEDSTVFPTCSELWIVPRGNFFFMIGAGTRQDEKTGKREEIAGIMATLRLDLD